MGGPKQSGKSFFQQFPNASDKVRPEDDLLRSLRVFEPDSLIQKFMYPIWKIMSSHNDYLRLEQTGESRLEEIYGEISNTLQLQKESKESKVGVGIGCNSLLIDNAEKMLHGVTQKTKRVCKIIESHKNFLLKIFERTDYLKKLYFCRLKYTSEEAVTSEGDLLNHPIYTIPGQPDNEIITYAIVEDIFTMVSGYRHLIALQRSVQTSLVVSFNNLSIWHSNFEDLSTKCQSMYKMFLEDTKN